MISGNKAQFDGIDPHRGEKRFKAVTALQDQVNRTLNRVPKATPGSFVSFNINPTVTALTPLKAVHGFAASQDKTSLKSEGLLDVLSVDFTRAVKELAAVLKDLQRLSELGDLPITYEHSTLKVHFPGCDRDTVETICSDFEVQRGVVNQDDDFDGFNGTEIALLFPFASSRTPSECSFLEKSVHGRQYVQPIEWEHMLSASVKSSDEYSTHSEDGFDECLDLEESITNPWLSSSPSGYESLHTSEADEMNSGAPLEYQGIEGMYRFMSHCQTSVR